MIAQEQVSEVIGSTAYDRSGSKLGKVGQVYLDGQTGRPEWITTQTGMFGSKESFVPINDASFDGGNVTVAYSKDKIREAPRIESDGELSPQDEATLYRYYDMDLPQQQTGAHDRTGSQERGGAHERADSSSEESDRAMTRSEEELRVGTEQRERGRARLRKYVVTEEQQVNVPVAREEAHIEREPITEGNRDEAMSGQPISEDEHEVTLHEERPVVSKEAHPVERVRMEKDTVREDETVSDEVRKERIEAEGAEDPNRSRSR